MMNKHVFAVVTAVKDLIGNEFLVTDTVEKYDGVLYERYGVMTKKGFVPIITLQHGYDVVHGRFTKTDKHEATALVAEEFSSSAYLLSKEKCVKGMCLINTITNNATSDVELWKTMLRDGIGSMNVTIASKDFKTLGIVHFNKMAMEIFSFRVYRKQQASIYAKSIGLVC